MLSYEINEIQNEIKQLCESKIEASLKKVPATIIPHDQNYLTFAPFHEIPRLFSSAVKFTDNFKFSRSVSYPSIFKTIKSYFQVKFTLKLA